MKPNQLILIILFLALFACRDSGNKIVIRGEITGEIPEKVEYTDPVRGSCNWGFAKSVVPDSLGKFEIELEPATKGAIFIKLRTSYSQQGTLIVEPGKTYDIRFDLTNTENVFSVSNKSAALQEAYSKLPNPEHIQVGAGEFFSDTSANHIKTTVEQRRTEEIAVFEKLLSENTISQNVFDLVKTDRDCYYDAVLATVGWIKDYMSMLGMGGPFT